MLHKRKPNVYDFPNYIFCLNNEVETLNYITICAAFEAEWKDIEALTEETAWNTLILEAKSRISPFSISRIIFGRDRNSRVSVRLNIVKGLISQEVVDKLNEFFPSYRDTKATITAIF
ncbi:37292_t:CDS:1 [Gigaspora margarita]|uniref:37292_t:CDS:1 n=1 Tax=Gigaspora margarita TaxID=4874 RepID=A0ABN7V0B6_GIGMA|nr:37292_t:CDS:1 [Gigaspora margarita]